MTTIIVHDETPPGARRSVGRCRPPPSAGAGSAPGATSAWGRPGPAVGPPTAGTWLLSTDADTTVPVDWVAAHRRHAADGVHAVAGLADLAATDHLADAALSCYRAIVEHGLHGATHHHVYGANLGVRADAYLAVGGFPPDGAGEDHGLWQRLAAAATPWRSRWASACGRAPGSAGVPTAASPGSCARCTGTVTTPTR